MLTHAIRMAGTLIHPLVCNSPFYPITKDFMKTLNALSATILSVMSISVVQARITVSPFYFNASKTTANFTVSPKSWSDPKWQGFGVALNAGWGIVHAKKGQTITLAMQSATSGIHPAASVWHRGKNDPEKDNIVADVAFTQMATMSSWASLMDCVVPLPLCPVDLVMQYVVHGYDADNNPVKKTLFKGLKDGVSGRLTLNFKAAYSGVYMVAVGGYNPAPFINNRKQYLIKTSVKVK